MSSNPSVDFQSNDNLFPIEVNNENRLLSKDAVKKHKRVLFQIKNRQKDPEEYVLNRYEIQAENQIKHFDKHFEGFKEKCHEENVGKVTLREISKRIDFLKVMKSRRLKERDGTY